MTAPAIVLPEAPNPTAFEAVLDRAEQTTGIFRRAIAEAFFDFMLGQRMDAKADGFIHAVVANVTERFAALYRANVPTNPRWPDAPWFGNVTDWLRYRKLDADTAEIIDEVLAKRIAEVQLRSPQLLMNEMFVVVEGEQAFKALNRWLDHLKFMAEIGEGRPFIVVRRELTILARARELLMDHVETNEGR